MSESLVTTPGYVSPLAQRVLDEAHARLGEHEEGGQNLGRIVIEVCQPFLSSERFKEEYAAGKLEWCAAYACYCWWRAWPAFRRFVSLSASQLFSNLSAQGWTWLATEVDRQPGPADIVFFVHRSLPGAEPAPPHFRHVGLCRGMDQGPPQRLLTIEGNASSGTGDTGTVRERSYVLPDSQIYGFARVVTP